MPQVTIQDHALWLSHIIDGQALVQRLDTLQAEEMVALEVDGIVGQWAKMEDGKNSRTTRGLKPIGAAIKAHWCDLQKERGKVVSIALVDEADIESLPLSTVPISVAQVDREEASAPMPSTPSLSFQGQPHESLPTIVAHADWGINPKKQWVTIAGLNQEGSYQTMDLRLVGELDTFFSTLKTLAGPGGSVLVGFDFPIGVPLRYAQQAGITNFMDALRSFGEGEWSDFYDVATHPDEISIHRPFFPKGSGKKGEFSRQQLLNGLGVGEYTDLLRVCDRATSTRRAANAIFWTLGGSQVGKGAIVGWRDLLAPALQADDKISIWPFDGSLGDLIRPGYITLAETYPAEFYDHLGLGFPKPQAGQRSGKRVQDARIVNGERLLDWASSSGIQVHDDLKEALLDGFGPSPDGEDPFDATVGLLGMLNVILGGRAFGEPEMEVVRTVEGWILGQEVSQ